MHPSSSNRILDQVGLNVIRIIIGSYFGAVSLDFIRGVNPDTLLRPVMSHLQADLVGSSILLLLSVLLMTGVCLRITALSLAIFVFSSSLLENFVSYSPENLSYFWRDVTLICAVILSYGSLDPVGLRRASAWRTLRLANRAANIRPRRVAPGLLRKRPVQHDVHKAYLALDTVQPDGASGDTGNMGNMGNTGDTDACETSKLTAQKPHIVHG